MTWKEAREHVKKQENWEARVSELPSLSKYVLKNINANFGNHRSTVHFTVRHDCIKEAEKCFPFIDFA
jgi:hypothetical protein